MLTGVGTGTLLIYCDNSEDIDRQPDVVEVCGISLLLLFIIIAFIALTQFGARKGIQPVKN